MEESGIIVDASPDDDITANQYKSIALLLLNNHDLYNQYRAKACLRAEKYKKEIAELSSCYRKLLRASTKKWM